MRCAALDEVDSAVHHIGFSPLSTSPRSDDGGLEIGHETQVEVSSKYCLSLPCWGASGHLDVPHES